MMIKLSHLDHVAIHVEDMECSAKWYVEVLSLERHLPKAWGEYPIFMVSAHAGSFGGNFGLAIFPITNPSLPVIDQKYGGRKIDHFAFGTMN